MSRPKHYTDLLKYSSLGLEMGAAVVIGLLAGIYLDRRFGTRLCRLTRLTPNSRTICRCQ